MSAAYAVCLDCGQHLDDNDAIRQHCDETMTPIDEQGLSSKSHSYRVVNPSPEETEERRVRNAVAWAIEEAVDDFIRAMENELDRGRLTTEQITDAVRSYPDFDDAWDAFLAEGGQS